MTPNKTEKITTFGLRLLELTTLNCVRQHTDNNMYNEYVLNSDLTFFRMLLKRCIYLRYNTSENAFFVKAI